MEPLILLLLVFLWLLLLSLFITNVLRALFWPRCSNRWIDKKLLEQIDPDTKDAADLPKAITMLRIIGKITPTSAVVLLKEPYPASRVSGNSRMAIPYLMEAAR